MREERWWVGTGEVGLEKLNVRVEWLWVVNMNFVSFGKMILDQWDGTIGS